MRVRKFTKKTNRWKIKEDKDKKNTENKDKDKKKLFYLRINLQHQI